MLVFLPYMKHYSKTSEQKLNRLEKIGSSWFIYKKFQVISTIFKFWVQLLVEMFKNLP